MHERPSSILLRFLFNTCHLSSNKVLAFYTISYSNISLSHDNDTYNSDGDVDVYDAPFATSFCILLTTLGPRKRKIQLLGPLFLLVMIPFRLSDAIAYLAILTIAIKRECFIYGPSSIHSPLANRVDIFFF